MSRLYQDFPEAQNEIRRDLAELGVLVRTETMQHFDIRDKPEFDTLELSNYSYTVLQPDYTQLEGVHEEWVTQEWEDRIAGDLNPGFSWKKRKEVWEPMLERDQFQQNQGKIGHFSYTYSMRMGGIHIRRLIEELRTHPNSRQLYLPVWYPIDEKRRGTRRVPCSLGYQLLKREDKLHITYMMRSCDFITHWANDVALATLLLEYVAHHTELEMGTLTQFVTSLHMYRKDAKGVF